MRRKRRSITRNLHNYHLEAILAVSYLIHSYGGTQFCPRTTARLVECLVKGFAESVRNPCLHCEIASDLYECYQQKHRQFRRVPNLEPA